MVKLTNEQLYRKKQIAMGNKTLYKWVPAKYHKMLSEILSSEEEIEIIIFNHLERKRKFYESQIDSFSYKPNSEAVVKDYPSVEIINVRYLENREKMKLRIVDLLASGNLTNKELVERLNAEGFRSWNNKVKKDSLISTVLVGRVRKCLD